ncbi:MAG: hypothetical protein V2I43_25800 [Parvularcula sp.]|nr:hypothetical protein [Parvularcula sp.]
MRISTVAEVTVAGSGLLLLILGVWSFADPEVFTDLYGINVAKPSATIALRSMIGGGEIGLGLFLIVGRKFGVALQPRLLLAVSLFACVFFARAVAVMMEWPEVSTAMLRELAIEGALAAAFLALHLQINRSTRDAD